MNFGKIAVGSLLVAVGIVLLAMRVGIAPSDTPLLFFRFWPVILIAFGLAFMASVIKNPILGFLSVVLILGGALLGVLWMNQRAKEGKQSFRVSLVDLAKTTPQSISVRVRTFAGRFYIGGGTPRPRTMSVRIQTFAADSAVGYRFAASGKDAFVQWPKQPGWLGLPPPGTRLDIRFPDRMPLDLSWRGWGASVHADLTRLDPTQCDFRGTASTILIGVRSAPHPQEIRIGGFASNVTMEIHGNSPVRLVSKSPFLFPSLPSDFMELARGRGKDRIYAVEGRGDPVRIVVDGPFTRIKIERYPTRLTWEDSEWLRPVGTASRSRSPWS